MGIICEHCGCEFIVPHIYDNYVGAVMCRKCFQHTWVRIENGFIKESKKA
jgi:hypothetical protein